MRNPASLLLPLLLLLRSSLVAATPSSDDADKKPAKGDPACTVTSLGSGNFFDLRPLQRLPGQTPPQKDWVAPGRDYEANFTINICGPVLADTGKVTGLDQAAWNNVSAFYEKGGERFSIGSISETPQMRGRKLVLHYQNGSVCPDAPHYRKSMMMSLMCDHEAYKPSFAFVGHAYECAYFFEVRTTAACAKAKTDQAQALGPVAVFGIIAAIAAVVYCAGGCVYQRTVMHARGWRQIPHYAAWAGIVTFLWNGLYFLWTAFIEHLPLPSSFRRSGMSGRGFGPRTVGGDSLAGSGLLGNGRRSSVDDDNQLIDELDDDDW